MRIYVASSWRNAYQPSVVEALREVGHEVYDFRNPEPDNDGFRWSEIDPDWEGWDTLAYRSLLTHPIAERGFKLDFDAMKWADCGVLLLPSGRSAHIEAGYFVGAGKPLHIFIPEKQEPELMYKMATGIHVTSTEMLAALDQESKNLGTNLMIHRAPLCPPCLRGASQGMQPPIEQSSNQAIEESQ